MKKPMLRIFKISFNQSHKWHIWFLPTHSPTLKNQKSHFLPTLCHRSDRKTYLNRLKNKIKFIDDFKRIEA
jgi:hypothetical protein